MCFGFPQSFLGALSQAPRESGVMLLTCNVGRSTLPTAVKLLGYPLLTFERPFLWTEGFALVKTIFKDCIWRDVDLTTGACCPIVSVPRSLQCVALVCAAVKTRCDGTTASELGAVLCAASGALVFAAPDASTESRHGGSKRKRSPSPAASALVAAAAAASSPAALNTSSAPPLPAAAAASAAGAAGFRARIPRLRIVSVSSVNGSGQAGAGVLAAPAAHTLPLTQTTASRVADGGCPADAFAPGCCCRCWQRR